MPGTQGPFWVRETNDGFEVCGNSSMSHAWVTVAIVGDLDADAAADAHLLAASYAMRESLAAILEHGVPTEEDIERARRVLAKANGEW